MEDEFGVAYQQTADEKDLEYAFFGIFDGHGGREAALFAKVSYFIEHKYYFFHCKYLNISGASDGLHCETEGVLGRR